MVIKVNWGCENRYLKSKLIALESRKKVIRRIEL